MSSAADEHGNRVFRHVHFLQFREEDDGLGCSRQSDAPLRAVLGDEMVLVSEETGAEEARLPLSQLCCFELAERSVAVRPRTAASKMSSSVLKFASSQDALDFIELISSRDKQRTTDGSVFDQRTEEASANQYFQFYGYLSQQQNMMQDFVRTATYQKAMMANLADFKDKVVLDVGAGSGILSFFAVQAGARRVYAVEASSMAQHCESLVRANGLDGKIKVVAGKIEEINLPEKVDVIVSEPMGYMLLNERMLETYLHAKKFLKPGGKMYPTRGDLHVAPFTDEALYAEQTSKANFWCQESFHGVNLTHLRREAVREYFKQPVVDTWHIGILTASSRVWKLDFSKAAEDDLYEIEIPFDFVLETTGLIHGLAFWFDVAFIGERETIWLSTSPTEPLTHWYQVRCLLEQPLFGKIGQKCVGKVQLHANARQSYDVDMDVTVDGRRSTASLDLKNPYFRYTGQPVQPPPSHSNVSPTDAYYNLVATGAPQPPQVQELDPASVPVQNGIPGPMVNGAGMLAQKPVVAQQNNIMELLANAHAAYQRTPAVAASMVGSGVVPNPNVQPVTSHPLKIYSSQPQQQQSPNMAFSSPGYPTVYYPATGQTGQLRPEALGQTLWN